MVSTRSRTVLIGLAGVATAAVLGMPAGNAAIDLGDGTSEWNSCRTIEWRLNLNGAPVKEKKRIRQAFAKISAATDLTFAYAGTTTAIPFRTASSFLDSSPHHDITVAFASPGRKKNQAPIFATLPPAGVGGYQPPGIGDDVEPFTVHGGALFDTSFVRRAPKREVLGLYMHELGHAIGMNHTRNKRDVMYPLTKGATRWSRNDRRQLTKVGHAGRPCQPLPPLPITATEAAIVNGDVIVTWTQHGSETRDPAGQHRPAVTRYTVTVEDDSGDVTTKSVAGDPTTTRHSVNLGSVTQWGPENVLVFKVVNGDSGTCYTEACSAYVRWYAPDQDE